MEYPHGEELSGNLTSCVHSGVFFLVLDEVHHGKADAFDWFVEGVGDTMGAAGAGPVGKCPSTLISADLLSCFPHIHCRWLMVLGNPSSGSRIGGRLRWARTMGTAAALPGKQVGTASADSGQMTCVPSQ